MTIDPMNAPIFGDVAPVNPPRPIRIATALLLGNIALTAAYRVWTTLDASFPLFLIISVLGVWFTVSMRAGRNWSRAAATVLCYLSIGMLGWVAAYAVTTGRPTWGWDILMLVVSGGILAAAIRLMWRPDVSDYFAP